jgi:adenine-specific DNA-methyltransferase
MLWRKRALRANAYAKAEAALTNLLEKIADSGATAIITFPTAKASNRLSGEHIKEIASLRFDVVEDRFLSQFSTLGGDQKHRSARQQTEEMILTLRAR